MSVDCDSSHYERDSEESNEQIISLLKRIVVLLEIATDVELGESGDFVE